MKTSGTSHEVIKQVTLVIRVEKRASRKKITDCCSLFIRVLSSSSARVKLKERENGLAYELSQEVFPSLLEIEMLALGCCFLSFLFCIRLFTAQSFPVIVISMEERHKMDFF